LRKCWSSTKVAWHFAAPILLLMTINATEAQALLWEIISAVPKHSHRLNSMGLLGCILGVLCMGAFFYLGWWFLERSLYQNLDDKDPSVQVRHTGSACPVYAPSSMLIVKVCSLCANSQITTQGSRYSGCTVFWLVQPFSSGSIYDAIELQILWSLVFTFSCTMVLLILFDLVNYSGEG
jgi:hypothetical protein